MLENSNRRSYLHACLWFVFSASAIVGIGMVFRSRLHHPAIPPPDPGSAGSGDGHCGSVLPGRRLAAACVCLVFALVLWGSVKKWHKIVLAAVMVLVTFSAVMSRLNYFEWMFHPVDSAAVRIRIGQQARSWRNDSRRPLRR